MNVPIQAGTDLRELIAPVLAEELYWFPVRHHSPAAAYFVSKAIAQRKPRCVLLEASTHFQNLLPFLLSKTKPPVALYSSVRSNTGQPSARAGASWYPILEYSPEWQAIKAADKVGAEILFIDLPHYCQPTKQLEAVGDSVSFFQSLADQAGYLNWHECWDALFEHMIDSPGAAADQEKFRQQLIAFAAAARYQANIEESTTMLARECYMWGNIQNALARYTEQETMVVCGALHVHMARDDSGYSDLCAEVERAEKEVTVNTTIVPYSYRRVAMQHGYAAGNRAPWFYNKLWRDRGKPDNRLMDHVREVLALARKMGHPVSAADSLAVAHHAVLLAQLRNREHPVLDDIEDAIWACCCKGNPAEQGARIEKALNRANIGTKIGTVNPDLGQLPLVSDFYAQMHLLEIDLPVHDERRKVSCDLRTAEGLARSQFLHRLRFLDLSCVKSSDQNLLSQARLFSENWTVTSLGSEEALIEYSEYGDTIDAVIQARLAILIEQQLNEIDKLATTLAESQVMGLGVFNRDVAEHFRDGLQACAEFNKQAYVYQCLLGIRTQQKFLDAIEPQTEPLLALCFLRASLALGKVTSVPVEEQSEFIDGVRVLAETWLSMKDLTVDRDVFEQELLRAATGQQSPLVHGCCFGLLLESGRRSLTEFLSELATYTGYSSGDSLVNAAIFIEGVMYTTKVSILSGADKFGQAIDALLRQAKQEDFLVMLPRLRAGFGALPRVQRDALASGVAKLYGLDSTAAVKLPASGVGVEDLSEIDRQVQEVMLKWGLAH